MIEKITAFVIDIVKYSDTRNVITLFSRERGRISCLSPSGNSKSSRMRNAMLQPLSVITTDLNFNESKEMHHLGKVELLLPWKSVYFNPFKSSVVLFLTEFLNKYLRTAAPDAPAFDFTVKSLAMLDRDETDIANFHITFLVRFLDVAGIRPDMSDYEDGDYFDMRAAVPVAYPPNHSASLDREQTRFLNQLLRINFRNSGKFKLSGRQRREIVTLLLRYYSIFYPGLDKLKSPDIISDIFS